jgi:hypothetical protein
MNVLSPVLHLLLINFKPHAGEVERQALVEELGRLHAIDGVQHLGAARAAGEGSTHMQALFIYLRDAAALETYGSHPLHMEYLRRVFLPAVEDFVSIDVGVQTAPPAAYEAASCCCANFRPDTYDWQIRSLFERAGDAPGAEEGWTVSGGVALNDRQRYRAAAVVFWCDEFASNERDRSRPQRRLLDDAWGQILTEAVFVTGPAHPLMAPSPREASR